ncbi:unnamed protein product [Adineta ricciae]|uniref:NAD(P)(+)--arginine ADP-ribosyltransferase n=1 Tax=Adineta ricciae TaxID=249248 RepID=A0A815UQL1_ADIRI|nr:unnamed protein product [Adineta ricciae]
MYTKNRFGDIDCSFDRLPAIYAYQLEKLVSLEEALKPIESQIDQLSFFIKTAKKRCHYPSDHNLTRDESASIYIYTMEWGDTSLYRLLNQALRNANRQVVNIWFPYLKLFDCALEKLPTLHKVLWRGISADIGKNFTKNQLVTWWSVNSCSLSVDVIKTFLGNNPKSTLFLIEALNGKDISKYTEFQNENEVILKMGTDFRVESNALDHPNGSFVVHLIEIDHDDDGSLATTENSIKKKTKFQQQGKVIAGGNGQGNKLNQLSNPFGIFIDENKTIFIAEFSNHRILKCESNEKQGQIVAGGNGEGRRLDQLYLPTDVIVDQQNHSIIIADSGNQRVIRWSKNRKPEILIRNIYCSALAMDKHGFLYVSNSIMSEVRKWNLYNINENTQGILVAGGNGQGDQRNQLNGPTFIFVDNDQSIYVSDLGNHRVVKWLKGAEEGIVVTGGNGAGNDLNQLKYPQGLFVDESNQIYVIDSSNHRIMRWCEGDREGEIIVGRNGEGNELNQLKDNGNHRIIRFDKIK